MDHKIIWSPAALEDVESIAEYIARDSEFYARAIVDKILARVRQLKEFPKTGSARA
jgi:toxin ParE1/3/4